MNDRESEALNLFFFKHKTAYEVRISDWSSDVCSSDLSGEASLAYALRDLYAKGQATEHDMVVASELVEVLTGGAKADHTEAVSEEAVLKMERAACMRLVKTPGTLARYEPMLATGTPVRNWWVADWSPKPHSTTTPPYTPS